jgi:hypothetical protein
MRLTLRTMLAYLDDILEPDDTEDIGKKIEESEFATNLVHRTRDCMRRLRLGVPGLIGRGLAADPNSVAEYLDNTLPADQVGEFEKVCLESDVHLAEVASCHQILTLVLGEPAEIDPASRQRLYRLATQIDAPPVQSDALRPASMAGGMTGSSAPAVSPPARRAKPEVPEYLRESRSRVWPVVVMVVLAAVLTFAGLMVFGPQWRERATALVSDDAADTAKAGDKPQSSAATAVTPASDVAADRAANARPSDPANSTAAGAPVANAPDAPNSAPPAAAESRDSAEPTATTTTPDVPPAAPSAESRRPADAPAADKATPAADVPRPTSPDPAVSPPADEQPEKPIDGVSERAPAAMETFGRYTSKRDILLKFDADAETWHRLPAMSTLSQGDRLLSLPLFRPMVSLSTGITIQAEGPSLVELVGWTEEGMPIIAVAYGRLVMATVGKAGNSLQLQLDDRRAQVTFVDADATLALDVHRVLPPGTDAEASPAPLAVDLYATSGMIRASEGDKVNDLQAPAVRSLTGVGVQQPSVDDFPKWVNSEMSTDAERLATTAVEPLMQPGEAAAATLKELTDSQHPLGKRREVRSLAIRSLTYLGDFDACVAALNDPKEKLAWGVCMEELRGAVARDPDTAAQVRATFEKQRGADASFLYRMLWGYSAADLKNGAAKDLVDSMDKDSLDARVMSFWNVQNITGSAHHGYRPEDIANKRRTPYNAWKEKLRQGKIVPHAGGVSPKGKAGAKGS